MDERTTDILDGEAFDKRKVGCYAGCRPLGAEISGMSGLGLRHNFEAHP